MLAILGGLLTPSAGTVRLSSEDGDLPIAGQVAWVLQTVNVLPDRSVIDNVMAGAYCDGVDRPTARGLSIPALHSVGLDGHEDRTIRTLSGGEAQRAAIARAVVNRRPVLLADEPTGQLDHANSHDVVRVLLSAAARKILIVVTHDMEVARRCSRVLRLGSGELVQVAS